MKHSYVSLLTISGVALFASHALAGTVVVTPADPQSWTLQNQRGTDTGAIDSTYPNAGDGSIHLTTSGSGDKADFEGTNNGNGFGTLDSVAGSTLAYDYYRDSSSTANGILAPVLRLEFFNSSTNTGGYLIWESAYNTNDATVATDAWVSEDITNGYFWLKPFGQPAVEEYNRTLSFWQNDPRVGGGVTIYGVNTGLGSGWSGTFAGAVDNITIAGNTYNFEAAGAAAPEPATWGLLGSALIGLAGIRKRLSRS